MQIWQAGVAAMTRTRYTKFGYAGVVGKIKYLDLIRSDVEKVAAEMATATADKEVILKDRLKEVEEYRQLTNRLTSTWTATGF